MYIFEDKEVNKITNFIRGSKLVAVASGAKEDSATYEQFRANAETIIEFNKGKNIEPLLKKIYVKYINTKGNNNKIELVNRYIIDMIEDSKYLEDIKDIESIIYQYKADGRIDKEEFTYLIDKLREKEYEIGEGI